MAPIDLHGLSEFSGTCDPVTLPHRQLADRGAVRQQDARCRLPAGPAGLRALAPHLGYSTPPFAGDLWPNG
ncbi:MAG: hypothetical protein WCB86_08320, partial [Candidatus Dormiibacterota bacterium]